MASQQHLFGPTPDPEQSQWFTPDWLAERIVEWSGIHGGNVLELGAGDGAFVVPLLRSGCEVVAVERDPRFVDVLRKLPHAHLTVLEGDVMRTPIARPGWADAYIGNPPYENEFDLEFVLRGLELAPRVVAVLRLVFLAGQERHRRLWSKHHLRRIAHLPARPEFIGSGPGGAKADFAVFDIGRGGAGIGTPLVATEWWTR